MRTSPEEGDRSMALYKLGDVYPTDVGDERVCRSKRLHHRQGGWSSRKKTAAFGWRDLARGTTRYISIGRQQAMCRTGTGPGVDTRIRGFFFPVVRGSQVSIVIRPCARLTPWAKDRCRNSGGGPVCECGNHRQREVWSHGASYQRKVFAERHLTLGAARQRWCAASSRAEEREKNLWTAAAH